MTLQEFLIRMLVAIQPNMGSAIAVLVITMIVTALLAGKAKNLRVEQYSFRWLGIFYDLSASERLALSCSWLKFILVLVFLAQFQKLNVVGYILFLLPALLYVLIAGEVKKMPGRFLWLFAQALALLSANLVCGFYHDVQGRVGLLVIYVFMALFTALLGFYLFLMELSDISEGRRAHIHDKK